MKIDSLNPICIDMTSEHFKDGILIKWVFTLERDFDMEIDFKWFNDLHKSLFDLADTRWLYIDSDKLICIWRPMYKWKTHKQKATFALKAIAVRKPLIEYKT